jgi:hypothetical protein
MDEEQKIRYALLGLTLVAIANGWQTWHIKKMHLEFKAALQKAFLDKLNDHAFDAEFDHIIEQFKED